MQGAWTPLYNIFNVAIDEPRSYILLWLRVNQACFGVQCWLIYSDTDSYIVSRLSKKSTSVGGMSNCTSGANVSVIFDLTFSTLADMVLRASTSSDTSLTRKMIVLYSVDTHSEGSKFLCSFSTIDSWLAGLQSCFAEWSPLSPLRLVFVQNLVFCTFPFLPDGAAGAFCTLIILSTVEMWCCLEICCLFIVFRSSSPPSSAVVAS